MHFWIDKRSQTCGFGRARVAASLSGGGLGFPHPPRRIGGKSIITPIHRIPSHSHRHQPSLPLHHQTHVQPPVQPATGPSHTHNNYQYQHQRHHYHHYHQHQSNGLHTQSNDCQLSIPTFGPSHSIELEEGALGNGQTNHIRQQQQQQQPIQVNGHIHTTESQLLPSHLKCGMWASLALATVFVAVFQGTGLEVLIFCAFSATFFLAACSVSICRRPRDISTLASGQNSINEPTLTRIEPIMPQIQTVELTTEGAASPPPYHIAILLPESSKESDDSPPPSYDKLDI